YRWFYIFFSVPAVPVVGEFGIFIDSLQYGKRADVIFYHFYTVFDTYVFAHFVCTHNHAPQYLALQHQAGMFFISPLLLCVVMYEYGLLPVGGQLPVYELADIRLVDEPAGSGFE